MKIVTFASCPQLAKSLMAESPHPSVMKPLATKEKKIAFLPKPKRRRRRRRTLKAATTE
jgi:hypothetical protein